MRSTWIGLGAATLWIGFATFAGCGGSDGVSTLGSGGQGSTSSGATSTTGSSTTGSSTTGSSTTGSSTTGSSTTGSSTTSSGMGGASSSSTSSGMGGASSSSTSSGMGGAGPCAADPNDPACVACTKASCCNEYTACLGDVVCTCYAKCVASGSSIVMCAGQCGQPDQTALTLYQCTQGSCAMQCGGGASSSSSSSSSGSPACQPMPGDNQCTKCAKTNCCNDVTACAADQTCTCWVGCIQGGGNLQMCTQQCGQPDANTVSLSNCTMNGCPGLCP